MGDSWDHVEKDRKAVLVMDRSEVQRLEIG